MTVFIDTSAFYAILDRDDVNHASAGEAWTHLLRDEYTLLTTNYVLLETCALLQSRLGIPALRAFHQDVVPLLQIGWVSEERHNSGVEAALAAARKRLSVVDCIAFQTMREHGVQTAFCFDRHYAEQGFTILPR
jgi:predicted nucleic acid-binding protein